MWLLTCIFSFFLLFHNSCAAVLLQKQVSKYFNSIKGNIFLLDIYLTWNNYKLLTSIKQGLKNKRFVRGPSYRLHFGPKIGRVGRSIFFLKKIWIHDSNVHWRMPFLGMQTSELVWSWCWKVLYSIHYICLKYLFWTVTIYSDILF